jgi:RimJ/RimL family protein N-acetyltransferase
MMPNPTPTELQGDLIRLRPIQSEDAEAAFPLAHDDRVTRTLVWDGPKSRYDLAEAYKRYADMWLQWSTYRFAIETNENSVFVGAIPYI